MTNVTRTLDQVAYLQGDPSVTGGQMRRGNWLIWLGMIMTVKAVALITLLSLAVWGQNLSLHTKEHIVGAVACGGIATLVSVTLWMFDRRYAAIRLGTCFTLAFAAFGLFMLAMP